jgi:hypothetical protein
MAFFTFLLSAWRLTLLRSSLAADFLLGILDSEFYIFLVYLKQIDATNNLNKNQEAGIAASLKKFSK